ncbi:hypothetical protein BC628DRAFT_1341679 [Trametes gibbosa]|nr:hypothetical protein BC628DRAFT_1341679 [Trametes gibbosa]
MTLSPENIQAAKYMLPSLDQLHDEQASTPKTTTQAKVLTVLTGDEESSSMSSSEFDGDGSGLSSRQSDLENMEHDPISLSNQLSAQISPVPTSSEVIRRTKQSKKDQRSSKDPKAPGNTFIPTPKKEEESNEDNLVRLGLGAVAGPPAPTSSNYVLVLPEKNGPLSLLAEHSDVQEALKGTGHPKRKLFIDVGWHSQSTYKHLLL